MSRPGDWWASLALVRGWRQGGRLFRALVVVQAFFCLLSVAVVVVSPLTDAALRHMQLSGTSYAGWSALHFRPAMYNFANEYMASAKPVTEAALDEPPKPGQPAAARHHLWLNHFQNQVPLWWYRGEVAREGRRTYLVLRSRFGAHNEASRWVIQASAKGELRFLPVDW